MKVSDAWDIILRQIDKVPYKRRLVCAKCAVRRLVRHR